MSSVAARELRNQTKALLGRVEAGEAVTITVRGRPVAELRPISAGRTWMPRGEFVERLSHSQADPGLSHDLEALTHHETTDDLES